MDGPLSYNKYQRVFRKCFGCKIFQTKQFSTQQNEGILPSGKTTRTRSFQVIDTDFADPIMYHNKKREEKRRKYSFHMQSNKGNPFIITARSNHR